VAISIENENFGYSVATWNNFAAIGNPDLLLYSQYPAAYHTGSVYVYRYNNQTDTHELVRILYAQDMSDEWLLAAETGSGGFPPTGSLVSASLHTEDYASSSVIFSKDKDILIDIGDYLTREDDAYGHSIDIWDTLLAVGCKYYHQRVTIGDTVGSVTGSVVDIYNLSKLDPKPFLPGITVLGTNSASYSGSYFETASIPPGYDRVDVLYTTNSLDPFDDRTVIDYFTPPYGGGAVYYSLPEPALGPSGSLAYRCGFNSDPLWASIPNPDLATTSSFGHKVAINENWLAVSSIHHSESKGAVYLFNKAKNFNFTSASADHFSWSYYQVLQPGDLLPNDQFGYDIDLNKETGSHSGSLMVGTGRSTGSRVYLYELQTANNTSSWVHVHTFTPETGSQFLTFYNSQPVYSSSATNPADGYGQSVALWGNVFAVGAPTDRYIYEYSGSSLYHQGAVYIYERCPEPALGFQLMLKSYGDEQILKDNRLGFSTDVYADRVVAGSPRYTGLSSCYVQGTYTDNAMFIADQCAINGQFLYFQKNTSSLNWDLVNTYQTKKKYLHPYTQYGHDIATHDDFIVVGSPMFLTDTNRLVNITGTGSLGETYGAFAGKAYIYNMNNFQNQFYVGNVFYRNGVLVINTSGSAFENLFLDTRTSDYQYTLDYKSKQTMYEMQITCQVEAGEFNTSTNPTSITKSDASFDINNNGQFDFQDADVLLKYMQFQNTEFDDTTTTNWSQSVNLDDGERSFFQWSDDSWKGTNQLFSSSYDYIDANLNSDLDINQDSKIDLNDITILWKYFSKRLNQKNYDIYLTPISRRKKYSDVADYLDSKSGRKSIPYINPHFLNYESNVRTDPTGSYLAPYVTSVGLYNGIELVAVAKLGNPIKLTPDFPYTFVVKMDF
jgi:hypothetical protein